MKLSIFIVLFLTIACSSDDNCYNVKNPSKASDCEGKLSDYDKSKNYAKCCYFKGEDGDADVAGKIVERCVPLTQDNYDHMDEFKKRAEVEIQILDCFSFYLKFGFLSILFLFL